MFRGKPQNIVEGYAVDINNVHNRMHIALFRDFNEAMIFAGSQLEHRSNCKSEIMIYCTVLHIFQQFLITVQIKI